MLEAIFGNRTIEKELLYRVVHRRVYARELVQAFALPVSVVQKQLLRLERGGVVGSRTQGRTRVFELDPGYAFTVELQALLRRALDFLPEGERAPLEPRRTRPRATGKPT